MLERWRALDFLFLLTFTMLWVALALYWFASAWFAPICASAQDLGTWCLPIGFEGPFADYWSNRSLSNARIAATIYLASALFLLWVLVFFVLLRPTPYSGKIITIAFAITLPVLFLGSCVLNNFS
jgi:hypothetical protein